MCTLRDKHLLFSRALESLKNLLPEGNYNLREFRLLLVNLLNCTKNNPVKEFKLSTDE